MIKVLWEGRAGTSEVQEKYANRGYQMSSLEISKRGTGYSQ